MTGASTVEGHGALRSNGPALGAAGRACDAVLRLLDSGEANEAAYNLLCNYLGAARRRSCGGERAGAALAFRLKLALAAGFSPELASCASCGEAEHLAAFSGSAGGVVCASCEGGGFPLSEEAHRFMVDALGAAAVGGARGRQAGGGSGRPGDHRDPRASRARAPAGGRVAADRPERQFDDAAPSLRQRWHAPADQLSRQAGEDRDLQGAGRGKESQSGE